MEYNLYREKKWDFGNGENYKKRNKGLIKYKVFLFNPLRTKRISVIQGLGAYRAVNAFHFGYENLSLNDVQGKSYCLFWQSYKTHKRNVITMLNFLMLILVVRKVTGRL